jgi:hypothetical protein
MKEYRYVIVSSQGATYDFQAGSKGRSTLGGFLKAPWYGSEDFQDLPELLAQGWQPVRESMMGGGSAAGGAVVAFSLVLLERDLPPSAIPVAQAADAERIQRK